MDSKQKKTVAKKSTKKQFKRCAILDGVAITEMTREQLESHINRLQQEVEKEKEERNYYQVERDRIQLFWEVCKQQLKEKDALLQLKDHELDETALTHLAEIKLYKQKMKHIMFESQQHINDKMKESLSSKITLEDQHEKQRTILENEIEKLKDQVYQLKVQHDEAMAEANLKHGEQLCAIQSEYEKELDELKSNEVLEIDSIKKELDSRCKQTIKKIEEEKNLHIEHLMKTHEQLLVKMKNYYSDIIQNNIFLINSIKEQTNVSRKNEQKIEKQLKILLTENEDLKTSLLESQTALMQQKKRAGRHDHDNINTISNMKLKALQQEVEKLKWENDELNEKLQTAEKERNVLHKKFMLAIQHAIVCGELKNLIQKRKLSLSH